MNKTPLYPIYYKHLTCTKDQRIFRTVMFSKRLRLTIRDFLLRTIVSMYSLVLALV